MRFELRIKTDPAIIVAFREEWPTGIWSSLVNLPFGFLDQSELAPLSRPSSGGRAFFWRFAEAHNVFLVMLREFSVVRCCIYWLQVHRGALSNKSNITTKKLRFLLLFQQFAM
ncbi:MULTISPECIES: hypothetical protein [Brucella/Ochrobactrum group]|uniref:hypothetical protein n=1 Tax=Brucella/Ochrobactrum group TaxID=2826938 RepID=UPI00178C206D|nr:MULTISPECIES: hypothetical protein [Brucella/Ochrobactrum group]MCQ9145105.1 hypothetical protein [Ochrobactrum sp. BTU2]UGQ23232.1 hypothetical protein LRL11_22330 [Brucella anthropi]